MRIICAHPRPTQKIDKIDLFSRGKNIHTFSVYVYSRAKLSETHTKQSACLAAWKIIGLRIRFLSLTTFGIHIHWF